MAGATGARGTILECSAFTLGGKEFIGNIVSGSCKIDVASIENRAAQDTVAYPRQTVMSWSISGTFVMDTTVIAYPADVQTKIIARQSLTIVWTTGYGTYTGTAFVSSFNHQAQDGQTMDIELTGQGAFTSIA